jgi:hypothetical protein
MQKSLWSVPDQSNDIDLNSDQSFI